jgi:hypothetical protein
MGANSSKLEKALAEAPEDERYYGLENFGNTCYCNSVLQALYFCKPFRERLLKYGAALPANVEENLLNCLADLFVQASSAAASQRPHARAPCAAGRIAKRPVPAVWQPRVSCAPCTVPADQLEQEEGGRLLAQEVCAAAQARQRALPGAHAPGGPGLPLGLGQGCPWGWAGAGPA